MCVCVSVIAEMHGGGRRGIRTSAQALKRSATGQEPFLIPPAGPGREDLDLSQLWAPTHNSS